MFNDAIFLDGGWQLWGELKVFVGEGYVTHGLARIKWLRACKGWFARLALLVPLSASWDLPSQRCCSPFPPLCVENNLEKGACGGLLGSTGSDLFRAFWTWQDHKIFAVKHFG